MCPTAFALVAILSIVSSVAAQHTPDTGPKDFAEHLQTYFGPKKFAEHLEKSHEDAVRTVERLHVALDEARKERDAILDRQLALRMKLIEHRLLPESVSEVMSALAMELIEVEVELYGKRGRIKSIEQAIDALAKKSQEEAGRDEVLAKLMEIVGIRQSTMAQMRALQERSVASEADLQSARAELAEAELRAAIRKNELAAGGGTAALAELNEQLRSATIDLAELEARREYISARLEEGRPLIELGVQHDRIAESELQRADRRIRDIEDRLQLAEEKAEQLGHAAAKARRDQTKEDDSSNATSSKD